MDLIGAWLRQLLQAGTAAALVPVAMVAALVVVLIGADELAEREARVGEGSSGVRDVAPVAPAVASESRVPRRPAASPPPAPMTQIEDIAGAG